jgi:hypothetical protein
MLDTKYLIAIAVLVVVIVYVIYYMHSSSSTTPTTPPAVPIVVNTIDLTNASFVYSYKAKLVYTYVKPGFYVNSATSTCLSCYTETYNGVKYYYGVSCGIASAGVGQYPTVNSTSGGIANGIVCFNPPGVTTPVLTSAQLDAIGVDTNVVVGTNVLTTASITTSWPKILASTSGPSSVKTDSSSTATKTVIDIVW